MGGFRAVLNVKFLADKGVTGVVNCAKGLEMFGYCPWILECCTRFDTKTHTHDVCYDPYCGKLT